MGLIDRLRGSPAAADGDDDQDDGDGKRPRRIVCIDIQDGTNHPQPDEIAEKEWYWKGEEPPTKKQFEFEYGSVLDPGVKYSLVPVGEGGRPIIEDVEWTIEKEPTRDMDDDLRAEIQELRRTVQEGGALAGDDLEEALIAEVAKSEGPSEALDQLQRLKAAENGGATDPFEEVDYGDRGEVMTAGIVDLLRKYDGVGDMVEDVIGGAASGAIGPAASAGGSDPQQTQLPTGQQGGQQAPQQGGAQAGANGQPAQQDGQQGGGGRSRTPKARERFEQLADGDQDDGDDDRRAGGGDRDLELGSDDDRDDDPDADDLDDDRDRLDSAGGQGPIADSMPDDDADPGGEEAETDPDDAETPAEAQTVRARSAMSAAPGDSPADPMETDGGPRDVQGIDGRGDDDEHTCDECGESYGSQQALAAHSKAHQGEGGQ